MQLRNFAKLVILARIFKRLNLSVFSVISVAELLFSLLLFVLGAGIATAQTYPEKPVTMIAPFSAGGSVDLVARAIAQQMSELWKQPVSAVRIIWRWCCSICCRMRASVM